MPYIWDSFCKGRTFTAPRQMQDADLVWCTQVDGQHSHRGIDCMAPADMFDQVECEVLNPLLSTVT
ncbi:hypothetical protein [Nocardia sp. 348MFTsu5.1]|uniref:hypothetical protein n=1 Tax=Nocardia sp. 348MFTsu5.1 TaxID=1172185 RepID=UPI00035E810B|nr:hypothetical protein [Nocardia sp. 348MFTsu5.1]